MADCCEGLDVLESGGGLSPGGPRGLGLFPRLYIRMEGVRVRWSDKSLSGRLVSVNGSHWDTHGSAEALKGWRCGVFMTGARERSSVWERSPLCLV